MGGEKRSNEIQALGKMRLGNGVERGGSCILKTTKTILHFQFRSVEAKVLPDEGEQLKSVSSLDTIKSVQMS